jgi:hypothetical protein
VFLAAGSFLEGGCRTVPAPRPLEGRASYESIEDPSAQTSELVSKREFLAAEPASGNQSPRYPDELVSLALPPQKLVVRLDVDERGQIAAVRPIENLSEIDSSHREAFEAAVKAAVAAWRFSPARRRTFEDSPDDGSGQPRYRILKSEVPAPTYVDVRFLFEVRDRKGVVTDAK